VIDCFMGDFAFLSNFFPSEIIHDGIAFPTVEHAYQAAKTNDRQEKLHIAIRATPGAAKRAGQKVTLRPDWEEVKIPIMKGFLTAKFTNTKMACLLANTKPHELVEGNTWGDTFWGVCENSGDNWLGKLLMEVRESL